MNKRLVLTICIGLAILGVTTLCGSLFFKIKGDPAVILWLSTPITGITMRDVLLLMVVWWILGFIRR